MGFSRSSILFKPKKALGQRFLVNSEIARAEAAFAAGKNVIEVGPGYGILTDELSKKAKSVVSVELDRQLYLLLKGRAAKNVRLLNKDFLKASDEELGAKSAEIMIANVPYSISSQIVEFAAAHGLEAVLCLQKEFAERMLAKPGTKAYSRLSVMSGLVFNARKVMDVSKSNFYPVPKVDSCIVHLTCTGYEFKPNEKEIISELMLHKKKRVRNAVLDSAEYLGIEKGELRRIANSLDERDKRVFMLEPNKLAELAEKLSRIRKSSKAPGPA